VTPWALTTTTTTTATTTTKTTCDVTTTVTTTTLTKVSHSSQSMNRFTPVNTTIDPKFHTIQCHGNGCMQEK
jgi:hypothetical protein